MTVFSAFAADSAKKNSDVIFAEDLIRELSTPAPLPQQIPDARPISSLLEPIEKLENSQLILIMFFGLILIFTLRTFFYMHSKKKQAERDTYAYDLHHSRSRRTPTGLHHQKRRKTASIPTASMSIENIQCSTMYLRRPRRSHYHESHPDSSSTKKSNGVKEQANP